MARLHRDPWPGFEHRDGEKLDDYIRRTDALLKEVSEKHTVLNFPMADGAALYAVVSESPLVVRHVPHGDAWHAAAATIRGLTMRDVEAQRRRDAAFRSMQDGNEAFYASLKAGQIVHYSHGFGEYVRCEVVEKDGANHLRQVALVGSWREYDLPRRRRDGTVHLGIHAEAVLGGKLMRPHSSNVFECPGHPRRPGQPDPSSLPPLDLSVPPPDPEQERLAALWRRVDEARRALDGTADDDPQKLIDRAVRILSAA